MKQRFVFIFRQGTRTLTAAEQKRRTEEVRNWALHHISGETALDPRILGEEGRQVGFAMASNAANVLTALNFLEAADLDEAARLAETHPGLRYGATIEVRPWSDPRSRPTAVPAT